MICKCLVPARVARWSHALCSYGINIVTLSPAPGDLGSVSHIQKQGFLPSVLTRLSLTRTP